MSTISYIKIFGPPVLKAVRELEKVAVDMPDVFIMDTIFARTREFPSYLARDLGMVKVIEKSWLIG